MPYDDVSIADAGSAHKDFGGPVPGDFFSGIYFEVK